MKNKREQTNDFTVDQTNAWVREALDPDQLSAAKQHMGRLSLTGKTVLLLWGLRGYVVLMVVLTAMQIWNAIHAG